MPKKSATTAPTARSRRRAPAEESDGTYLLKLIVFVLLGTLWLKFTTPLVWGGWVFTGIPLGLLIGLPLVHHFEKNTEDRKIWYACLVVITIVCVFAPVGIFI